MSDATHASLCQSCLCPAFVARCTVRSEQAASQSDCDDAYASSSCRSHRLSWTVGLRTDSKDRTRHHRHLHGADGSRPHWLDVVLRRAPWPEVIKGGVEDSLGAMQCDGDRVS